MHYNFQLSPIPTYRFADIDECSYGKVMTGCSHSCTNFPGGYQCQCPSGYQLAADNKTCHGKYKLVKKSRPWPFSLLIPCINLYGEGFFFCFSFLGTSSASSVCLVFFFLLLLLLLLFLLLLLLLINDCFSANSNNQTHTIT